MSRLKVFVSYSHDMADRAYFDRFMHHLGCEAVQKHVEVWHDQRIVTGRPWPTEIHENIDRADLAILLVSPTFLSSPYICKTEVPKFRERQVRDSMQVQWLLLYPCTCEDWLQSIQDYQTDGRALSEMTLAEYDGIFTKVCKSLCELAKHKYPTITTNMGQAVILPHAADGVDGKTDPAAEIVKRFCDAEEGPISLSRHKQPTCAVAPERAYRMTRFMLENEQFQHFLALDLVFERWAKLNISDDLLEAITTSLNTGRCKDFRRIVVIRASAKSGRSGHKALKRLLHHDKTWNPKEAVRNETKILTYPTEDPCDMELIKDIHDFTLFKDVSHAPVGSEFRRGSTDFAIIETSLTGPATSSMILRKAKFELTVDQGRIYDMEMGFEELWKKSKKISDYLA